MPTTYPKNQIIARVDDRPVLLRGHIEGGKDSPWHDVWLGFTASDGTETTCIYRDITEAPDHGTILQNVYARAIYFKDADETSARQALLEIAETIAAAIMWVGDA